MTFTVGFPILDVLVVLVGLLGLALFASGVREAYIASPAITLGGAGLAVSGVIISIAAGALVFSDIAGAFVDTTAFLWGRYNRLFPVRGDGERRVVDVERLVVLL